MNPNDDPTKRKGNPGTPPASPYGPHPHGVDEAPDASQRPDGIPPRRATRTRRREDRRWISGARAGNRRNLGVAADPGGSQSSRGSQSDDEDDEVDEVEPGGQGRVKNPEE
ncbi:MAG: hypothetical protein K2V38_03675 [Gemmataceae bacterium]|nr:hypothetical protein [Gemmataceae bacterium]